MFVRFRVYSDNVSETHPYYNPYIKVYARDLITGFSVHTFNKDVDMAKGECLKILREHRRARLRRMFCLGK